MDRKSFFRSLTLAVLPALIASAAHAQSSQTHRILPHSVTMGSPNGEKTLVIPLRVYMEYGFGRTESKPSPAGAVDMRRHQYTIGADFMTSSLTFWGISLRYVDIEDRGSSPLAFSINTDKELTGGRMYVARYVMPDVLAGVSTEYYRAKSSTLYNLAVTVNENSDFFSVSPFLLRDFTIDSRTRLRAGAIINFNSGSFDYDINIPPTASTRETVLRLPLALEYDVSRNFTLSGTAQWNEILSISTFANIPQPDRSTMTLSLGSRFTFDNGVAVYANVNHDVFDDAYTSTRFTLGLSSALRAQSPRGIFNALR